MTNKEKYELIRFDILEQRRKILSLNKRISKKTFIPRIYRITLKEFIFECTGERYLDENKIYKFYDLIVRKFDDEKIIIETES